MAAERLASVFRKSGGRTRALVTGVDGWFCSAGCVSQHPPDGGVHQGAADGRRARPAPGGVVHNHGGHHGRDARGRHTPPGAWLVAQTS